MDAPATSFSLRLQTLFGALLFLWCAAALPGRMAADEPVPIAIPNAGAAQAGESPFPATVALAAEGVLLRAGPGDDYYPTERLGQGQTVELWAIDRSGYCAVRPVAGSYSWVRAADVDDLAALGDAATRPGDRSELGQSGQGRSTGVIVADGAVARVGSQLNDLRHVAQVRLEAGERVQVIEEVRIPTGRHAGLWLRIDPPAGEFRWVHARDLLLTPPLSAALAASGFAPQPTPAEAAPVSPGETLEAMRAAGAAIALAVNHEPLPAASAAPPQELGVGPSTRRMRSGWLPLGTGVFEAAAPAPLAVSEPPAVATNDEFADIDLALSLAVAGPSDTWNLPQLRERLRLAAARTNTPQNRLRADAIDARLSRFEAIVARQQALAAAPPSDSSPLRLGSMWSSLGGVGSRPIRPGVLPGGMPADGQNTWAPPDLGETTGRLATVVSRRPDAPRWALVDANNTVLVFVTPQPGVNLAPLVGQQVSVRGSRGYMPEYKRPYMVASEARVRMAATAAPPGETLR